MEVRKKLETFGRMWHISWRSSRSAQRRRSPHNVMRSHVCWHTARILQGGVQQAAANPTSYILYPPPYAFTPFLNPPPTSTLQNTKTRSTPQLTTKQKAQPKTQSTYQHNTKSQHTNEIKTTSFPDTSTLQNTKTQNTSKLNKNTKTQNKIKTTSFPHTSHPIPPPTLSPHFSSRLANQPFQTRNTQCTSQIPHQNSSYISKSKHLPTQHHIPTHKRNQNTLLPPHLTSYTPPCAFTPFLNPPKISTSQNTIHKAPPKSHTEIPNTHAPTLNNP